MKKLVLLAAAIVFAAAPALMAEEKTLTGSLSDDKCNGKHSKDEHGATQAGDHDCATKCVTGGAKNVFVSADGKTIYKIANQDFAGLKIHAGHKVALTGDLKGDTITVSKIEMPPAAKGKQ